MFVDPPGRDPVLGKRIETVGGCVSQGGWVVGGGVRVVVVVVLVVVVLVLVVVVLVVVVVGVVVVGVGEPSPPPPPPATTATPTAAAPPTIPRTRPVEIPPPVTNPAGIVPVAEPMTTFADSTTGARGPESHVPLSVTRTMCSGVRVSANSRSIPAM
jgi:hypothetical protein